MLGLMVIGKSLKCKSLVPVSLALTLRSDFLLMFALKAAAAVRAFVKSLSVFNLETCHL